jgi:hypothetical protein
MLKEPEQCVRDDILVAVIDIIFKWN